MSGDVRSDFRQTTIGRTTLRRWRICALAFSLFQLSCRPVMHANHAPEAERPAAMLNLSKPCSATALYVFLKMSDRPVTLSRVIEELELANIDDSVTAPRLCEVAGRFGVRLRVVELQPSDVKKISGPWIAFLKPCDGQGPGHYAVARLVGDGSKLQLIDPPSKPVLGDVSEPFRDGAWCRIALVPDHGLTPLSVGLIAIFAVSFGISLWIVRRNAKFHSVRSTV